MRAIKNPNSIQAPAELLLNATNKNVHPRASLSDLSPLETLPAELRTEIYEYLIDGPVPIGVPGFESRPDAPENEREYLALLRTSKLFYIELRKFASRNVDLGCYTQKQHRDYPTCANLLLREHTPRLASDLCQYVQEVSFEYQQTSYNRNALQDIVEYTNDLLHYFPNLRFVKASVGFSRSHLISNKKCLCLPIDEMGNIPRHEIQELITQHGMSMPLQLGVSIHPSDQATIRWLRSEAPGISVV